jgi:rsbT co-antagonist protein RsbR
MSAASHPTWVQFLTENRDALLTRWAEVASSTLSGRMTPSELERDVRDIFDGILAAEAQASTDRSALADEAYADVRGLLAELSRTRARQGFTPTETAVGVFGLKEAAIGLLDEKQDLSAYRDFAALSRRVDDLGLFMLETYAATRESVIAEQADTLLELSTPVVKIWDGVVAVPLVGTLDSARTQVVMESLLQALVETSSEHAIIDITGVGAVDTQVAQHLLKTVQAARLLGAECIISGIRPQIAQTVVGLGIDFGDISTKSSLADALLLALRESGLDIVERDGAQDAR